jgi:hypothetical protein
MRRLNFGAPSGDFQKWVTDCLRQIERASGEASAERIADDFIITTLSERRTLDVSTASATEVAEFIGTFIAALKKRGTRNPSS